ncbi:uncharacterized protein LOC127849985, partial [Dreissena polymorpha]
TDSEIVEHEPAGPSRPVTLEGVLHVDRVAALRCHCPSILQRWAARPRHWPSPVIVRKVVSLGAFLTPVGFKDSQYKDIEWRICFNTGEAELVNNLNGTQAHVHVMLKMILKDVLRPRKKEVTSYVIKNIVLWQAERNPQNSFDTRSFFHWLQNGLRELKNAIVTQQLSYYMIPERNLMAACGLQDKQQRQWVAAISEMMDDGPWVIMRLPRIRQAILASPEPMLWFIKKRMELEMLFLEGLNRHDTVQNENGIVDESDSECDAILQDILRRRGELVTEVAQRMLEEGSSVTNMSAITWRLLM